MIQNGRMVYYLKGRQLLRIVIVTVLVLTNYVPEVSVRHEEQTLIINTWFKMHVRCVSALRNNGDNPKRSLNFTVTLEFFSSRKVEWVKE